VGETVANHVMGQIMGYLGDPATGRAIGKESTR
jgi:hypothetical protein